MDVETMPQAQIVRATVNDAQQVRELTRAAYSKWVPRIGREPIPMSTDYRRAVQDNVVDMLLVDGVLVGLIEMILKDTYLLIENVAVDPRYQGCGYGRHLISHAESLARVQGHREVRLYTNALFKENTRLYSRLGYSPEREEAYKGGVLVHMSKLLA
jgi:GNAT superfamily N-acetyltransferase